MALLNKIDSNVSGLRYAEELSIGVLPVTPEWIPLEPNSYNDFGGQITTVARNPINPSRQRKKGVVTDLDAAGGFNNDLTQENLQDVLQGVFFADLRRKGEELVTNVDGINEEYDVVLTAGFQVGNLIFGKNFTDGANNGLRRVTTVTLDTSVEVAENLVNEAAPPATAQIVVVGFQGAAGDIDVDSTGTLPALTSTVLDFTTLGLIPGEPIFIGGDLAALAFVTAANNGFARIRSITANRMEFDKTQSTMVTEASTTETIQLFFGRVLKNELDTSIVRRTYQVERTLGAPDDSFPTQIQSEYLVGAIPNETTVNIPTADKVNIDISFVAIDAEQRTGVIGVKTGNRPALTEADAFNTSSDFSLLKMAQVIAGDAAPAPLFAFLQELTITINNNVSPNKAIGTLGAFEVTAGTFQVGGSMVAYLASVTAVQAVRNNADVTIHAAIVKANSGIFIDLPLLSLGDGRPNVEQDEPITLPISMDAATAAKIDPTLDYTALMCFYDYLPTLADL